MIRLAEAGVDKRSCVWFFVPLLRALFELVKSTSGFHQGNRLLHRCGLETDKNMDAAGQLTGCLQRDDRLLIHGLLLDARPVHPWAQ